MPFQDLVQYAVNYGIGVVLTVGMAVFMVWMLKYVFTQNEMREKEYREIIKGDIGLVANRVKEHDERSEKSIRSMEEALRRQREEHESQKVFLQQISDENDRRREAQTLIVSSLSQINSSLAAINANTTNCNKR